MPEENHIQLQWLIHRENLTDVPKQILKKVKAQTKKFKAVKVPGDLQNTTFYPRPDRKKKCVEEYLKRKSNQ